MSALLTSARLSSLKQEILGPAATPLERLLVERIAVCWLQAYLADIRYAQAKDLLTPAVQVNIGAQQVNVAGS